jgi:hypothetical protein
LKITYGREKPCCPAQNVNKKIRVLEKPGLSALAVFTAPGIMIQS